jgi:hypothetical protein
MQLVGALVGGALILASCTDKSAAPAASASSPAPKPTEPEPKPKYVDDDKPDNDVPGAAKARAACEAGKPTDCLELGTRYLQGNGVEHSPEKAAPLLKRACDAGLGLACYQLGYLYYQGLGVKESDAAARAAWKKGCKAGHQPSCDDGEQ